MKRRGPAGAGSNGDAPFTLRIRVGLGVDLQTLAGGTLDTYLSERRLRSMETAKQGISVDVTFDVRLKSADSAEALVKALNRLEGVQDVRLERIEFEGV